MPNNERLVAQLQEDLTARDHALDDAATENNERELSRRSWFDEAQRLQAMLAERDALLRGIVHNYNHGHLKETHAAIMAADDALSASTELEVKS